MDAPSYTRPTSWAARRFAPARWFFNYLNSGIVGGASIDVRYINAITLIGTLNIAASVVIEFSSGNPVMAVFMGVITLCSVFNVLLLRRTHDAEFASSIILLFMLVMLTAMLSDGMYENTGPIWLATFPALAFFFKGKMEGMRWLSALLAIQLAIMLLQTFNQLHTPYSTPALGLILASTVTVGMIVYVYESLRAKAEASLQQAREDLHHLAHTDMLTGLPNRTAFYDQLPLSIAHAKRDKCHLAVMFIDLDDFKPINDTYGHEAGDELLQQVASRLRQQLRSSDYIARFGGDEFVAILPGINEHHEIGIISDKLIGALSSPFSVQGHPCQIGVSIGIGLYPDCGSSVDSLVQLADHAMYTAKLSGKNRYAFCPFTLEDDTSAYKGKCSCNRSCLSDTVYEASP